MLSCSCALRRAGISLLEVLISIGILSIGLLATLALIPAGRTLIRKAEIENRAAALIPNAFATMGGLGLFRVSAIDWQTNPPQSDPPAARDDGEPHGLRPPQFRAPGPENYIPNDPPDGKDGESVELRWQQPDPAPRLSGTAPAGQRVWIRMNGQPIGDANADSSGQWRFPQNPPNPPTLALPAPGLGTNAAMDPWQPTQASHSYRDLQFTAFWEEEVGAPPNTTLVPRPVSVTVTPDPDAIQRLPGDVTSGDPAVYRQYHLRRRQSREVGDTVVVLQVNPNTRNNESPGDSRLIDFPTLGETVFDRQLRYVFKSRVRLQGEVWRWQEGTRRCRWDRLLDFFNRNQCNSIPPTEWPTSHTRYFGTPPNLIPYVYGYSPGPDIDGNYGTIWLDENESDKNPQGPDRVIEDADWFQINVEAGQTLLIDWSMTDSSYLNHAFKPHAETGYLSRPEYIFPVYFNGDGESDATLLPPAGTPGSTSVVYAIPGDGYVRTRIRLKPATLDAHGNVDRSPGVQVINDDDHPIRINTDPHPNPAAPNPGYSLDLTLVRNDRVVVVDPMMCTRLDRILEQLPNSAPHSFKRRRFADFQQTFIGTNSQKSFVIPRLNWQMVSMAQRIQAIGLADFLCRPQDNLQVDLAQPQNRRDGPSLPVFDRLAGFNLRRQSTDRMSWLLMLQPEDPGSVPANWQVGKYFEASVVVFEDRLLPATEPPSAVEGEYAFMGEWTAADGMIQTEVPKTLGIADEDVQKLFRTGAWVLLAPRQTLPVAPIDDQTKLEWVEILTADIKRLPDRTIVRFLPAIEPDELLTGTQSLTVLAYQGVVNVVSRSVQISE